MPEALQYVFKLLTNKGDSMEFIYDCIYVVSSKTCIVLHSYIIVVLHRILSEGELPWHS